MGKDWKIGDPLSKEDATWCLVTLITHTKPVVSEAVAKALVASITALCPYFKVRATQQADETWTVEEAMKDYLPPDYRTD